MCDFSNGRYVEYVETGIAQRLAEQEARVWPDRGSPGIGVVRWYERSVYAKAPQRVVQQVVRAAIQRTRRNNVRTRAHQRGDREMQRSLAARRSNCARAAFKRRHAFFENSDGRIRYARINVARALHVEKRRG